MSRVNAVMKIYYTGSSGKFNLFFLPWVILFSSFAINFLLTLVTKTEIYTGGLSSIYVYMFIIGIISLNATFPFAIGFSVRRKDYFLGTMLMFIALSAANAFLLWLFALVESRVIEGWGTQLHFFYLPYVNDGSLLEQLILYFIVMLFMLVTGFVISSVYRRFGFQGLLIALSVVSLIFTVGGFICTYYSWWGAIFNWFNQQTAFGIGLWTLPIGLGFLLISYLLLRKATI